MKDRTPPQTSRAAQPARTLGASTRALYYPYIEFQSLDWLKCALLYWEGVKRIVPDEDYVPRDADQVRALVEAGLVENVLAAPIAVEIADEFAARLANGKTRADGVQARERIATSVRMHSSKFEQDSVALMLLEQGYATRRGDWLDMDGRLAQDYMTLLATTISGRHNAPTVTDGLGVEAERLRQDYGTGPACNEDEPRAPDALSLVWLTCPFPTPAALRDVSMEAVLQFRERHGAERRAFRAWVDEFGGRLSRLPGPEVFNDAVADERHVVQEQLAVVRETMRGLGIQQMASVLALSVPGGLVAAAAPWPEPVKLAAAGLGLGVSLLKMHYDSRRERRAAVNGSPLHYLLSADREFPLDTAQRAYVDATAEWFGR